MPARKKASGPGEARVWERPEPARRPSPGPLSREAIVSAAIALADAEGLPSVSLRKVGAALEAGPMRLYGYVATKEELLELMVDRVYEEMLSDEPPRGAWRVALRSMAHHIRRAAQKHPWFIELLGGRPAQGPSALAYREAALAALSDTPGLEDIGAVLQAVRTVNAYVIGALWSEASELRAERESGLDKAQWQTANWPYLQRMLATGRFPTIARVVWDAVHPPPEREFEEGLDCVLDGLAARLAR